jgi:hypothetical protein
LTSASGWLPVMRSCSVGGNDAETLFHLP